MDMVYRSQYKQEDVGMYLSEVWDTLHQADTIHVTIANPLVRGGILSLYGAPESYESESS